MKFVTTCHGHGFSSYGYRLFDNLGLLPGPLVWYTEGFTLEPGKCEQRALESIEALVAFKEKYARYVSPSYLYDAVRFSNKVFAAYDALRNHTGIGVWIDADCVPYKDLPAELIERRLGNAYIALFKRAGMYSETGFWAINCSHEAHGQFMDSWIKWYTEGRFSGLANWTDCETLDATVRLFERKGLISSISLSDGHEKSIHPMALSEVGQYIDHCKGDRKTAGFSPENIHRLGPEPYQLNDTK